MKYLVAIYLFLPILAYFVLPFFFNKSTISGKRKSIAIFVLGDLGHSPRMSYHALSFSKLNYYVTLCGYLQSLPSEDVLDDVNIDIKQIPVVVNHGEFFLLFAFRKVCSQVMHLFSILFQLRGVDYILIQNPPSLPILLVAIVFVKLFSRNTRIIIDWHNLNYSILNLKYNNENHPLVRFLRSYEKYLSRFAAYNLTVTKRMKKYLIDEFGLDSKRILILHDRPPTAFQPLENRKEVLDTNYIFEGIGEKHKILVSSTSFTPDEDFNILLGALKAYDSNSSNQPLLLIVTGKGPMKQAFLDRVEELHFLKKVIIKTAWLSIEEYPVILATADLGISLHTSSSGIDLPMKIVDFFGCGVPVISLDFAAIGELVKQNHNGIIVKGDDPAGEICKQLERLFTDEEKLAIIKRGALEESNLRWDENWMKTMKSRFSFE